MSYFCGGHYLIMRLVFLTFFFFVLKSSMANDTENPILLELSSREELVQMAGYGEEKLSTVLVSGSVLCEAFLHGEPQLREWPIQGALVGVHCHGRGKSKSSCSQAETDEYGDFLIELPSHLHATPNLENICSVKVLRLPKKSLCRSAYVRKHKGLKLASVGNGIRTYSAGSLKFQHLTSKPLSACIKQKSSEKQM